MDMGDTLAHAGFSRHGCCLCNTHIPHVQACVCSEYLPPPPCRSPPLVVPRGGGSLGQPKIFRCGSLCCCEGDCVVGHCHLYPLHSWQDILLTFAEMELDSTTMFPPGTSMMFIRSTGEPVLAQVIGHSEHGDAYRRITYDRDGKTVFHDRASVWRLSLPRAPSPPRVYGGGAVPQGGVGDRHLVTVPQGVVGDRLPWGGEQQGGGVLFQKAAIAPCALYFQDHLNIWYRGHLELGYIEQLKLKKLLSWAQFWETRTTSLNKRRPHRRRSAFMEHPQNQPPPQPINATDGHGPGH